MSTIALKLDPRQLANPDADIRYLLPDLLSERSQGNIADDGYDYVGEEQMLILYLKVNVIESAIDCILDTVQNVRVLDNDLSTATVGIERVGGYEVVYPSNLKGVYLKEM